MERRSCDDNGSCTEKPREKFAKIEILPVSTRVEVSGSAPAAINAGGWRRLALPLEELGDGSQRDKKG